MFFCVGKIKCSNQMFSAESSTHNAKEMNMTDTPLPGLAGLIYDYIVARAHCTNRNFALVASVVTLSTASAARYRIDYPSMRPRAPDEDGLLRQTVTQGAMLVGPSGSGKGCTIDAVRQLLRIVGDDYPIQNFGSQEGVWQTAIRTPGALVIWEHTSQHDLVRHEAVHPHRVKPGIFEALSELQRSAYSGVARRPFRTRSDRHPACLPSSPLTILTESHPRAFEKKLDPWFGPSDYFGRLLLTWADEPRYHHYGGDRCDPSPELIARLKQLTDQRHSGEIVTVQWERDAGRFADFACRMVAIAESNRSAADGTLPTPCELFADKLINVASLLAIGVDPERPIITSVELLAALEMTRYSFAILEHGLDQSEVPAAM
jgi:hypothetical protein